MQVQKQEKSPIKQNILLYLAHKGVTSYEFYKNSGVTRGILQQGNGISEDNIARFLAYAPDVNVEWLITGKGEMVKSSVSSNVPTPSTQPAISDNPAVGIPYYDVDFLGGFDEVFSDQTTIPFTNIVIKGFEKADLWCNVTGHSMEPKICHGDIIALRRCRIDDIQYGEIYAVVLDTIRTIKIIRRASDPRRLRFVPINTNSYDEQEFDMTRIIHIYEVVGSISKFF